MNEMLKNAGFTLISEGFENQWNPDGEAKKRAFEFGKRLAAE